MVFLLLSLYNVTQIYFQEWPFSVLGTQLVYSSQGKTISLIGFRWPFCLKTSSLQSVTLQTVQKLHSGIVNRLRISCGGLTYTITVKTLRVWAIIVPNGFFFSLLEWRKAKLHVSCNTQDQMLAKEPKSRSSNVENKIKPSGWWFMGVWPLSLLSSLSDWNDEFFNHGKKTINYSLCVTK